jgi:hypothetical protein
MIHFGIKKVGRSENGPDFSEAAASASLASKPRATAAVVRAFGCFSVGASAAPSLSLSL